VTKQRVEPPTESRHFGAYCRVKSSSSLRRLLIWSLGRCKNILVVNDLRNIDELGKLTLQGLGNQKPELLCRGTSKIFYHERGHRGRA
jgi:hypothetical protein